MTKFVRRTVHDLPLIGLAILGSAWAGSATAQTAVANNERSADVMVIGGISSRRLISAKRASRSASSRVAQFLRN